MKTFWKTLVLMAIVFISSSPARAQDGCPDYMLGLEPQHRMLLVSGESLLQKQALYNITTLARRCHGLITFSGLLPDLIEMYGNVEPADQAMVLDAIVAVNDASAMSRLQGLLRDSQSELPADALWARIVERSDAGRVPQL